MYTIQITYSNLANQFVQGNCTGPQPTLSDLELPLTSAQLHSFVPGQCVLVVDFDVMVVVGSLWLDNLYVRFRGPAPNDGIFWEYFWVKDSAKLWMTNMTLQVCVATCHGLLGRLDKSNRASMSCRSRENTCLPHANGPMCRETGAVV